MGGEQNLLISNEFRVHGNYRCAGMPNPTAESFDRLPNTRHEILHGPLAWAGAFLELLRPQSLGATISSQLGLREGPQTDEIARFNWAKQDTAFEPLAASTAGR